VTRATFLMADHSRPSTRKTLPRTE
jgi:hypothetical protein